MKNILILINAYYPNFNANLNCAKQYIDGLSARGHRIDVFTIGEQAQPDTPDIVDGIEVYRFPNRYVQQIQRINSDRRWYTRLTNLTKKAALHLFDYLKNLEPITANLQNELFIQKAMELNALRKYDCIIAFSLSFSMAQLAGQIKTELHEKGLRFIYVQFDPFTKNRALSAVKMRFRRRAEQHILELADEIIIPPELSRDFRDDFAEYLNKVTELSFPLLRRQTAKECQYNNNRQLSMLMIGNYYEKIRNPKTALRILSCRKRTEDRIVICGAGCERLISGFCANKDNGSIYIGSVNKSDMPELIDSSDILINIGNTIDNQTPSKIFELMATEKPIIHFYRIDNDTSLNYLQHYSRALCIDERKSAALNIQLIMEFSESVRNRSIFESTISLPDSFYAENIVSKFIALVER